MNLNFHSIDKNNFFEKMPFKSFISGLLVIAFIILFIVLWTSAPISPQIEDINGPNNFDLQIITDDEIVSNSLRSTGYNKGTNHTDKTINYYSEQFSGTEELNTDEFNNKFYEIDVDNFELKSGNAKIVVVENGKIIYEFKPNCGYQSFESDGRNVNVILAGESANFDLTYSTK